MREIELRRAAVNTPGGRDRRRSGRQQRETPRDLLRQLSKVLAPASQPIRGTPQLPPPVPARRDRERLNDVEEEDEVLERPRLSMPLGEEDDDDSLLLPPQSEGLGMYDDNLTTRSVELPRRAASEIPGGRLSRGSFGSIRTSDRFDQTLPDFGDGTFLADIVDQSFVPGGFDEDDEPMLDDPSLMDGATRTMDIRRGRDSDIRGYLQEEDENTFAFQIPRRETMRLEQLEELGVTADEAREARRSMGIVREDIEEESDEENEPFRGDTRLSFMDDDSRLNARDARSRLSTRDGASRLSERGEKTMVEEEAGEEEKMKEAEEDNDLESEPEADQEEEDAEGEGENIEESGSENEADLTINRTGNTTIRSQHNISMADEQTLGAQSELTGPKKRGRPRGIPSKKKTVRLSKHGLPYPSLPAGVVKKLATTLSGGGKTKISKDTLTAIMQASDWFFEQVSDDLGAYAEHRGGKTIEESDVLTLMKRQRQINVQTTPFALAEKYLPRELLSDLRMVPPAKLRGGRKTAQEENE